ncbi:conserved hypothetical protein [Xenorhabdus bovienii str. Jollieti]|nr:conserved hypothetical protein [Xenorhabdus bovienii str. Jollieti]
MSKLKMALKSAIVQPLSHTYNRRNEEERLWKSLLQPLSFSCWLLQEWHWATFLSVKVFREVVVVWGVLVWRKFVIAQNPAIPVKNAWQEKLLVMRSWKKTEFFEVFFVVKKFSAKKCDPLPDTQRVFVGCSDDVERVTFAVSLL